MMLFVAAVIGWLLGIMSVAAYDYYDIVWRHK